MPTGQVVVGEPPALAGGQRGEHAVEGALVDVGAGGCVATAAQPVDRAERRRGWREERVRVGAALAP